MKESEFEDCINLDIYKEMISEEYGVDLSILPQFKNNNKWSIRLKIHLFQVENLMMRLWKRKLNQK